MGHVKQMLLNSLVSAVMRQLLSLVPISYLLTLAGSWYSEGKLALDSVLPPGFLSVLSILSAPILIYHAFVLPIWKYKQRKEHKRLRRERKKREHLKALVADAYQKLKLVRTPALMRPSQNPPPNLTYMEEEALLALRRLAHELWRCRAGPQGQDHPAIEWEEAARTGDRLLNKNEWHVYLAGEYARLSGEH